MASTYLTRTPSSSGNRKTWTLSMWVKRSNDNYSQLSGTGTGSTYLLIGFGDTQPRILQSSGAGEAVSVQINNKCKDVNGYYHLVFRVDTTQATASNRIRMYINGEEGTYSETDYPSQNLDMYYNYNIVHGIGARGDGDAKFEGIMSHVHFADGQSLAPTVFGESDSATGEWKIITNPSFTLGTNGFSILKDGNTITDQSSNSNNWTLAGGTLTKTEDNPSNVFATWNPLSPNDSITYSYGNGVVTGSNATNYSMSCSTTLGASSGKYYWEMKYSTAGNGNECIGVANFDNYEYNQNMTSGTTGYVSLRWDGERQINGATTSNYFTPPGTGAVLMCAMDMDNGKVFFGSNGTWFGSGNPVTGANPTADILTSGTWGGILRYLSSKWECNFGNGYFADNTVSSAGTNASNNGIFEYDVPTGYTALSTKGLNL